MIDHLSFAMHADLIEAHLPVASSIIGNHMFTGCSSLRNVTIGRIGVLESFALNLVDANITQIGSYAFGSVRINRITIGVRTSFNEDSFRAIDGNLFVHFVYNNNFNLSLLKIVFAIPNVNTVWLNDHLLINASHVDFSTTQFTSLPDSEFANTSYVEVILPPNLNQLSYGLFERCSSLVHVDIISQITQIPNNVFNGCTSLKTISIRYVDVLSNGVLNFSLSSINSVGNSAFNTILSITQINFPKSNFVVGSNSFANCVNLETVLFNQIEGFTYDLNNAPFQNDRFLRKVVIPANTQCSYITPLIRFSTVFAGSSLSSKSWEDFDCVSAGGGTSSIVTTQSQINPSTILPTSNNQPSSTDSRTTQSTLNGDNSNEGGLSGGAIAGIIISILVVAGLAIGGFLFYTKRKSTQNFAAYDSRQDDLFEVLV